MRTYQNSNEITGDSPPKRGHSSSIYRVLAAIVAIAIAISMSLALPAPAKIWKSEGKWLISGSPTLGGCTMATKFASGSFLSVSSVMQDREHVWEVLVSEGAWQGIQSEMIYPVDVLFPGSGQSARPVKMIGFKASGTHSVITNALTLQFLRTSDHFAFFSAGIQTGRSMNLVRNGELLGSFDLEHADAAFQDLTACLNSRAANFEA